MMASSWVDCRENKKGLFRQAGGTGEVGGVGWGLNITMS
jgi:hypothetical protein